MGSETLSQSNLSFGIILPLSLIVYALAFRLELPWMWFPGIALFVLISNAALVVVGVDRRYSYRLGLRSLILGRLEKQQIDRMQAIQKEGRQ